jgi:hypothetical protein
MPYRETIPGGGKIKPFNSKLRKKETIENIE